MGKTSLEKIFIYLLLILIGIYALGTMFLAVLFCRPYDFQLSPKGELYDYFMKSEVDNNITAYKRIHTTLYFKGKCGFWIIDLKKKRFKLLRGQITDKDEKNIDDIISRKKIEYGTRLQIINNVNQLSYREKIIYDKFITDKNFYKHIDINKKNINNYFPIEDWGPYQEPIEYFFY